MNLLNLLKPKPRADAELIIARGHEAARLLANETLLNAIEDLQSRNLKSWSVTGGSDVEAREMYWLAHRQIEDLQNQLRAYVDAGRLETAKLERMRKSTTNGR